MNISIVTDHSLWWLFPIIILAFAFAYWRYYYQNKQGNELSRQKLFVLASLRFLTISFLLFLLLNPRVKYRKKIIEKPVLLFAQDNSSSIVSGNDSLYYKEKYPKIIQNLKKKLSSKYELQFLQFGDEVKSGDQFDFQDSKTDFSHLVRDIQNNYSGTSNTQVLISSDGIYNSGANPLYSVQQLGLPIHILQLGDTSQYNDLLIQSLQSNEIGFTKTNLPVRVGIKAINLKGERTTLEIYDKKKLFYSEKINLSSNDFYEEKDLLLPLDQPGLKRFRVRLKSTAKEFNHKNNSSSFIVDVLDAKRKIGIYFAKYHPDIAAIKSAIEKNENFEVELIDINQKTKENQNYNLLVLYQLPGIDHPAGRILQNIKQKKLPMLIVTGTDTDYQRLNSADLGIKISTQQNLYSNASFSKNEEFHLFSMEDELTKEFSQLPPLRSPMGNFQFLHDHHILAYQEIKSVSTNHALLAFTNHEEQKIAWILGEGVWRWKQYAYLQNNSHDYFNEMINKLVQYIALKEKRDNLLVKHAKVFHRGEQILIRAEYYNQVYELENKNEIDFLLKDEEGKVYPFVFAKKEDAYQLEISDLPLGRYTYEAKVKNTDKIRKGEFYVQKSNLEANQMIANSKMLQQIALLSHGEYFHKNQTNECIDYLLENENSKSSISYLTQYGDFTNWKFFLFLFLCLFVLEWFLLKYWQGI